MVANTQVKPFTINIPQAELDDLQDRLKRTRWPDEAADSGWTMGTNLAYMKSLTGYWQKEYDWRKHEAELNQLKHFTADVKGVNIHFIHERGKGPNPTPLLLLHGWPDSFYRYHKLIPMLTDPASHGGDPAQSFDVVVPSLPGFAFSDKQPTTYESYADLFAALMTEVLGYDKFVSGGGDSGSMISLTLAQKYPEMMRGIYLTDVGYPDHTTDFASLTPPEQEFAGYLQGWFMREGAFNMIQSTKPQSLAYAMNDSPVGLAAWVMNFMTMGSTGEEIDQRFGRDEILTNIMIYWLTESIGSTFRMYLIGSQAEPSSIRPDVPAAVAHCPWDAPLPREWADRKVNVVHFTEFPRGGHFTAWEEPALVAADIQDFVRKLAQ